MADKPTYEELIKRVKELEKETPDRMQLKTDPRFFKIAIESSISAIGIADLEGKLIYVNDSCVKMWGYNNKSEVLGRFLPEFFEGDGVHKTVKELHEKGVALGEDVGKRKDGSLFFVQFTASMLKNEAGIPSFMFGSFFDITKRNQTEKALQESENRFRSLVESSPVGMCIIQQNRIVYQNYSLKRLLESLSENFENHVLDYLHPDDIEKCKKAYRQITSGRNPTLEVSFRFYPPGKKDPKVGLCWVQCRASLVDYQGEDAILINMTDITRVKEMEHLLTIKQKMSSLGHVAAGIAHEIRNPLTGINSYLYTLEDLCDSEIIEGDQIEMIKQIIRQFQLASNKIEAVIKRVLDFSRPNPPKMDLIDLNQCIERTLNLSSIMLSDNDIKVEKSLKPDLPKCYGDAHLIEQVIANLINNAARAMAKKQKAKKIRIDSFPKKKSLYIQVSDSGPGIPNELKDQIFNPFFTTSHNGTGIGLSIAQRIVTDHNGTIEILRSKWGGATLSVELPIEKRRHST